MFLSKINTTIYVWKVRIDAWKLGTPLFLSPRLRISNFRDIFLMRGKYDIVLHEWRGSNPEGSISDKKRACPSPSAPSFRLLRKPQSKLAHRELRRFFLKSFPRSSTRWGEGRERLIHVEFHDRLLLSFSRGKEKYRCILSLNLFLTPAQNRIQDHNSSRKWILILNSNKNRIQDHNHFIKRIIEESYRIKNTRASENKRKRET